MSNRLRKSKIMPKLIPKRKTVIPDDRLCTTILARFLERQLRLDLLESCSPFVDILQSIADGVHFLLECELLLSRPYGRNLPCAVFARQTQESLMVLGQRRPVRDGNQSCSRISFAIPLERGSDSLMPRSLACWYMEPSTSVETALVHSSSTPNLGHM